MSANNISMKVDRDIKTMTVTFSVYDKEADKVVDSLTLDVAKIEDDDIVKQIRLYGFTKLAMDRTSDVGKGDKKAEKLEAMQKVFDNFVAGFYEAERMPVGARVVSYEIQALSLMKKVDIPTIQKSLDNYTKEQREAILGDEKVKKAAERLRAKGMPEAIDLGDMLI